MLEFKLSIKNLLGAKLRTFLNLFVLSISFVVIILLNSLMDGWDDQAKKDSINWEYGYGHLINNNYDPLDPFTINDGHSKIPQGSENLLPILVHQGSIYPKGRMINIKVNGTFPEQDLLKLPLNETLKSSSKYPVIIGKRFAESTGLKEGDDVLFRWRDKNGTYDANNVTIIKVFDSNVPTIDVGQFWISINTLWEMTGQKNEATYFVANESFINKKFDGWTFRSQESLLKVITDLVSQKKIQQSIVYILLMGIALLAIFDTQVLSIFRRQKEIGTLIALGMTRKRVVKLFTIEGSLYSILAIVFGSIYGSPIFYLLYKNGFPVPPADQKVGIAISDFIYPLYSFKLVAGTIFLVLLSSIIVSFIPTKKISKMNPVLALKGKLQ